MAFLSKDNLQLCNRVFRKYMRGSLGLEVHDDPDLRRLLYGSMQSVMTRYGKDPQKSVRDLNNIMLTQSRDLYVAKYHPHVPSSSKTEAGATSSSGKKGGRRSATAIDRERSVFGDRLVPVPSFDDRPKDSTAIDDDEDDSRIAMMRKKQTPHRQQQQEDDVERALALMLSSRGGEEADDDDADPTTQHFRRIMREETSSRKEDDDEEGEGEEEETPVLVVDDVEGEGEEEEEEQEENVVSPYEPQKYVVDPRPQPQQLRGDALNGPHHLAETVTYLSINGFDRNWTQDPYRYRFTAKTASGEMRTTFRNITFLQATLLVIPMEAPAGIRDTRTTFLRNRTVFQHDFSFSLPYVLLCIDGIDDVYDGTNPNVRGAFCKFVYNKHYRANDTRGYVVLQPMQDEIKWFLPTPMASLPNLSLSVRRPNGMLMNESRDDYGLSRIDFSEVNDTVLSVELSKFYDVNEFTKGDHVIFRAEFELSPLSDAATDAEKTVRRDFEEGLRMLSDYMNRVEGHEVIEVGNMNESGMMRDFHIFAPGKMDQKAGEVTLNTEAVDALNKFNDDGHTLKGHIMNASLQSTVSFKMGMRVADAQQAFVPSLGDH